MVRKICVALLVFWGACLSGAQPAIPEPLKELLDKMPPISFAGSATEFDNALATLEEKSKRSSGEWDERTKKFARYYRAICFAIDSALEGFYAQLKERKLKERFAHPDVSEEALRKIKASSDTRDPKKWKPGVDYIPQLYFDQFISTVFSKILQAGQAAIYFDDLLKIKNLQRQDSTFELNQDKAQVLEEYLSFLKSIGILLIEELAIPFVKDVKISAPSEGLVEGAKLFTERQRYTHYLKTKMEAKIAESAPLGETIFTSLFNPLIYFVEMLALFDEQLIKLFQLGLDEWKTEGFEAFRKHLQGQLDIVEKSGKLFSTLLKFKLKHEQRELEGLSRFLSTAAHGKSDLEQVTYQLQELAAVS